MFSALNLYQRTLDSLWRRAFQRMPGALEAPADPSSCHEQVADRWRGCRRQHMILLQRVAAGLYHEPISGI
jgi:hypothetical protein